MFEATQRFAFLGAKSPAERKASLYPDEYARLKTMIKVQLTTIAKQTRRVR